MTATNVRPFQLVALTLSVGESRAVPAVGTYLRVLEASHDAFTVSVDDTQPLIWPKGIGATMPQGFRTVRITNESAGSVLAVTLAAAPAPVDDSRLSAVGAVPVVSSASAVPLADLPDVALGAGLTAEVVAANSERRGVWVGSLSTNTVTVRIGAATVAAGRGMELAPGDRFFLDTTAAVHAHNPGGASVTLTVVEG